MSRSQPVPILILDASGQYDLAWDGLQVLLRRVTPKAARVLGYFYQSKSALLQRAREAGIVMTKAANRWIDQMPDRPRDWRLVQST
jgi:hypothetical protein